MKLQIEMSEGFYLCSDCHWYHENIIKYCNRPFKNAEEMNEVMFNNWQETISPEDKVIYLGDWVIGSDKKYAIAQVLHDELNGKKLFIQGNHDEQLHKHTTIKTIKGTIEVKYKGLNILLCHEPIWDFDHDLQVCGHIHNNEVNNQLKWNMFNAGMEMTNYTPVHIDDVIQTIKDRGHLIGMNSSSFLRETI